MECFVGGGRRFEAKQSLFSFSLGTLVCFFCVSLLVCCCFLSRVLSKSLSKVVVLRYISSLARSVIVGRVTSKSLQRGSKLAKSIYPT